MYETHLANGPLTPGLAVETFDGKRLGTVESVGASGLLIRRRYRDGIWLPEGLVREVDDSRVLLHIDSRVLPRYSEKTGKRNPRSVLFGPRAMAAAAALLVASAAFMGFV